MTETTHTVELERAATLSLLRCASRQLPGFMRQPFLDIAELIERGEHLQHLRDHEETDRGAGEARELQRKAEEVNLRLKYARLPGQVMKGIVAPMLTDILMGTGQAESLRGFIARAEAALAEHEAAKAPPATPETPAPEVPPAG